MARAARKRNRSPEPAKRPWLSQERNFYRAIAVLAFLGLALASYLTYLDYSHAETGFCEVGSGCDTVRESEYVTLLSVPVSLIGVVGYIAMLGVALGSFGGRFKKTSLGAMAIVGFVFSLYLTYVELFVIHAICPYCVASAGTMAAIFLLLLLRRPVVPGVPGPRVALLGAALAAVVILGAVFLPKEITAAASPEPAPTALPTSTHTPSPRLTPTPTPTIPQETPEEREFRIALAKHLGDIGAVMYGTEACGWCRLQRAMFGDALQYINEVYCMGPPEANPQPRLCTDKGIRRTPTWEINGKLYPGFKTPWELARLSNYEGPMPSESSSP